jgi:serine/threonine protein phosphatase PrpC
LCSGHIVHVGDSRCYLVRSGVARQLTNDHSWLNVGYILLGELVRGFARRIRQEKTCSSPLGMKDTTFRPDLASG